MQMKKKKNFNQLLFMKESNFTKSNYHLRLSLIRSIILSTKTEFNLNWKYESQQQIAFESDKIFMKKKKSILNSFCINGKNSKPHLLYSCKLESNVKIEDLLVLDHHVGGSNIHHLKSSLLLLTHTNWLYKYDIETGRLLQKIKITSMPYKFKSLDWNENGYILSIKSSKCKLENDIVVVLASFSAYPLKFIGICEIRKSIFGNDVTDAVLYENILIIQHGSCKTAKLKLYCWETIVKTYLKNDTSSMEFEGFSTNILMSRKPKLLFECCTNSHSFQVGGRPWQYMIMKPKYEGTYEVYSFANDTKLYNGLIENDKHHIETPMAFFHPDESNRIMLETANSLQVFNIKSNSSRTEVRFGFEITLDKKIDIMKPSTYKTKSGRTIKRKHSHDEVSVEAFYQSLLAVDFEDELNLLYCLFDDGEGKLLINVYCNEFGKLLKVIKLPTYSYEGSQHTIKGDKELIIHLCRTASPSQTYILSLYKIKFV